jgi:hypothetical protein
MKYSYELSLSVIRADITNGRLAFIITTEEEIKPGVAVTMLLTTGEMTVENMQLVFLREEDDE